MHIYSPLEVLARALAHAANEALPDVQYMKRDPEAMANMSAGERMEALRTGTGPQMEARRRPDQDECEVIALFPQHWGSRALGFGGLAGQACTTAYTTIVRGPEGHLAFYWNGRHAYNLNPADQTDAQRLALRKDLVAFWSAKKAEAAERYGAH